MAQRPAAVRITEIPRAGLVTDVHVEHAIAAGLPLADALAQATATPDVASPEQLHRLGETTGYHVASWDGQPDPRCRLHPPDRPLHTPPLTDLYLPSTGPTTHHP
jgi:hypothetical protein